MNITIVTNPAADREDSHSGTNGHSFRENPFSKLPLGAIVPHGWIRYQLDCMVEGMTGMLTEVSAYLSDGNGWLGGNNEGWEEQPYWFRGFHDLAVLTGDKRLLDQAEKWIEAVIQSQDASGYFGARYHRLVQGDNGHAICDLWPHMIMLDAVIHHYEYSTDKRVIPFMTRFFEFCRDLPDAEFMPVFDGEKQQHDFRTGFANWRVFIQNDRAGDMLPHIYWLYERIREPWLLDVASRFFAHITPAYGEWLSSHIVHFTQRFAYPAIYWRQSGESWHREQTEYWYRQHMATWGQQPRGVFGADENVRPGKVDPRQGFETCGAVEFAKNFYALGRITGDSLYADRCEDILLNHFPAMQTPDLKGLHYLTASNLPQLDAGNEHDFFNEENARKHGKTNPQLLYSPHRFRCCQHNVAMGWPWYAQNLWQATSDNGLCAWMYGASTVTAKAGEDRKEVVWESATDYPFRGAVRLTMVEGESTFPLYLRIPGWCREMNICINNSLLDMDTTPGGYLRIERHWEAGDTVTLDMAMEIKATRWPRTGAATIDRGPLSYSIRIEEEWRRCGGTDEWPEWEVFPKTPWNYAILIGEEHLPMAISVEEKEIDSPQPWTIDAAPVVLRVKVKRIPEWKLHNGMVPELVPSPVHSEEKEETISMIPMGCARLRMACLPVAENEKTVYDN